MRQANTSTSTPTHPLSPRQVEILLLLVEKGMMPKQIAMHLGCSRTTVTRHLMKITSRLNVETLYQAVHVATVQGFFEE
jgi:DNA-binding NarL/FixJ family response regulator